MIFQSHQAKHSASSPSPSRLNNLDEALAGKDIPEDVRRALVLVDVPHVSFSGDIKQGQIVVHEALVQDVGDIFSDLLAARFPIQQIVPVCAFDWDDDASMAANNSSAFNYRVIYGTNRLSQHASGRAIDINPIQNPFVRGALVMPSGAVYDQRMPGTVTPQIAEIFKSRGWQWGGEWEDRKDWQHFEKPATS